MAEVAYSEPRTVQEHGPSIAILVSREASALSVVDTACTAFIAYEIYSYSCLLATCRGRSMGVELVRPIIDFPGGLNCHGGS